MSLGPSANHDPCYMIYQNQPQLLSLKDYEQTKGKLVNIFSLDSAIVAIYQMGSVTVPGISDLDIVLVFDEEAGTPNADYLQHLNWKDRYALMHSPFLMTKGCFQKIGYFFSPRNFTLLWGDDLEFEEAPARKFLDLLLAAEESLETLPSIVRQLDLGVVKVRPTLCELSSLKHGYELVGLRRNGFTEGWKLQDRVSELRRKWFEADDKRFGTLGDLLRASLDVSLQFLWVLEKLIEEKSCGVEADPECRELSGLSVNQKFIPTESGRFPSVRGNWLSKLLAHSLRIPLSRQVLDIHWMSQLYTFPVPSRLLRLISHGPRASSHSIYQVFTRRQDMRREHFRSLGSLAADFSRLIPSFGDSRKPLGLKWCVLSRLNRILFRGYAGGR